MLNWVNIISYVLIENQFKREHGLDYLMFRI
jgi:hypothetical protein